MLQRFTAWAAAHMTYVVFWLVIMSIFLAVSAGLWYKLSQIVELLRQLNERK